MATPFPAEFGRVGREGLVVEFETAAGATWVGNFRPRGPGASGTLDHPDGRHVLVVSGGDVYSVDPERREADLIAFAVDGWWHVDDGVIMSRQGLAFFRIGPPGIVWHTRRLSFDGFDRVHLEGTLLHALAWSLDDCWVPCTVDVVTGCSQGGSYGESDSEGWERLAAGNLESGGLP